MRTTVYAIAAVAMLATAVTIPTGAKAQGVEIEGPGVGVHVGRDRDHWRDRRGYREHETYGYSRGAGCRSVTVRERLPNGTMVIRKKRTCD